MPPNRIDGTPRGAPPPQGRPQQPPSSPSTPIAPTTPAAPSPPPLPDVSPRTAPVDGVELPREAATLERLLRADGVAVSATEPLRRTLLAIDPSRPCRTDEIMVGHYSLENLFDAVDDTTTQDEEFLPQSPVAYDDAKVAQHMHNLGTAIRTMNGGRGPDVLSLTEVENGEVLRRFRDEALGDLNYQTIGHLTDTDARGIEGAVLSRYPMIGAPVLHPVIDTAGKKMRGILEVNLDVNGNPLTVLVNHWLSSRAGDNRAKADARRTFAAQTVQRIIDEKIATNPEAEVVVLGDFNEGLNGPALRSVKANTAEEARQTHQVFDTIDTLENLREAAQAEGDAVQLGTHFYAPTGTWSQLDHALVSHTLLDGQGLAWVPGSTAVHAPDALRDARGAPRRYFLPQFRTNPDPPQVDPGGMSDHFPIAMRLRVVGGARRPASEDAPPPGP